MMRARKYIVATFLLIVACETALAAAPQAPAVRTGDDNFTYDSKGRRDPFAPPGKGQGGIEEINNLKLEGVISDRNGMCAVIGGQVVKRGDKVFDAEVLAITNDSVTLQYGNERVELKIQRSGDEKQKTEE